ncbi:class I SAM-dependent methyltransferase [Alteromonas gracilis]|uniref:class I SAM-dependent methyltransferase n=1 Tax=Alteromonas gracilis TaxID=1479524 RepID=UPI00321BD211
MFTKDYAYFSSTSLSWVEHARIFVENLVKRQKLGEQSFVVELAANDGYLLQYISNRNIPCLGVEPTTAVATVAREKGINIEECFFGFSQAKKLLDKYPKADVIIANNVLAHVPDINDFVAGIETMLADAGIVSIEFPHLLNLIKCKQFDTIYHEHFSYLSLVAVKSILGDVGLEIIDVEKLSTHGGSLRVWAKKLDGVNFGSVSENVKTVIEEEEAFGLLSKAVYQQFPRDVEVISGELIKFLTNAKEQGKRIVAYGAAAKGNTLLNYAGIGTEIVDAVFDAAQSKQGKWLPGSHIPILSPDKLNEFAPDVVLILPWNIADEIVSVLDDKLPEKCEFIVAVPQIKTIQRRRRVDETVYS